MILSRVSIRVELRFGSSCDGSVNLIVIERIKHRRRTKGHRLEGAFLDYPSHRVSVHQLTRDHTPIPPERRSSEEHEAGRLEVRQEGRPGICGRVMGLVEDDEVEEVLASSWRERRRRTCRSCYDNVKLRKRLPCMLFF
jgi:hypothetical protein